MISLYDLLKAANGQLFGEPVAQLFKDFCLNPEQAGESLLYVSLNPSRRLAEEAIAQAIENGVSGVLCSHPPECDTEGVSVLMVRDVMDALMSWVRFTLDKSGVKIIAVAGTSGTSTDVEIIGHILSTRYAVLRGHSSLVGRLGLILSLAPLRPGHQFVVLNLNTTRPGEMALLINAVQPNVVVLARTDCMYNTSFDDCEQLLVEYDSLIESLTPEQLLVVNFDDEQIVKLAAHAQVPMRTIGVDRFGADALAFNIIQGLERTGFDLRFDNERISGRWSPLLGKYHLYGLLAALVVGHFFDIDVHDALKSSTKLKPLTGRMNPLQGRNRTFLVDDTYRATPASVLAVLDWLRHVRENGRRAICVVGDMETPHFNGQMLYREVGRRVAEVADVVVTQGTEAALVGRMALDNGLPSAHVHMAYGARDAVRALQQVNFRPDDIIVVMGGAESRMERVVSALLGSDADRELLIQVEQDHLRTTERPMRPVYPSWVEVDATILANNVRILRKLLDDDVTLMAVVKANAYGHGAVVVARTALLNGAGYLGVASMAEALELREAGIDAPILIMSYTPVEAVRQAIRLQLTVTVYDLDSARAYQQAAKNASGVLRCHIKLDTGMGRLGILPDDAIMFFRHFAVMPNLQLEGVFTHFASADDDAEYTAYQSREFMKIVRSVQASGLEIKYIHAANSAGALVDETFHFNMIRPGLMLYGLRPSDKWAFPKGVKPFLAWKTTVLQVKTMPPGSYIGYGRTYRTRGTETIAILPVGYADGIRRAPQAWRYVLIHGQRAPVVGRISMEKTAVDVSRIENVSNGDEVVLIGRQGNDEISADEVARWFGTISYEVLTSISSRIPRL